MTATVDLDAGSALAVIRAATEAVRAAAAALPADRLWSSSCGELVELLRAHAELAAAAEVLGLAVVREADAQGTATDFGMPSTQSWLAHLLLITPGEAKTRVKDAEVVCRKAPQVGAALGSGAVNVEQARAITRSLRKIEPLASAAEYAEAEHRLLTEAKVLNATDLTRLGDYIATVLDPDGSPGRDERARRARSFTLINLGNGQHRIRGILDDEAAALVNAAVDVLGAPRPAVDGDKDPRSAEQRRADALRDMASAFLRFGDLPETRGHRPHVYITTTAGTANGDPGAHPYARTATGEDLSPETLRKICCDAGLTPIVVNTLGEPLSVGRSTRTWTPAIWAALVARDIGCVFPGCTKPAAWTQGHHIKYWTRDLGPTELRNGALLCDYHHDQVHHHGWQVRLAQDGHPELIPPPWVDPLQQPQRNHHWRLLREGLRTDPDRGP